MPASAVVQLDFIPASTNFRVPATKISGDPGCAPTARGEDPIMEIAAVVLITSVLLWFLEEATDEHV